MNLAGNIRLKDIEQTLQEVSLYLRDMEQATPPGVKREYLLSAHLASDRALASTRKASKVSDQLAQRLEKKE